MQVLLSSEREQMQVAEVCTARVFEAALLTASFKITVATSIDQPYSDSPTSVSIQEPRVYIICRFNNDHTW